MDMCIEYDVVAEKNLFAGMELEAICVLLVKRVERYCVKTE